MERCVAKCTNLSLFYLASIETPAFSQHGNDMGAKPEQYSIAELQVMSYICKTVA